MDANGAGIQPVHRVFLIQPLVVVDEESGRACLQRSDYVAEFLSAYIANMTIDVALDHLEKLQGQLAAALNTSTTRSVAGKLVEAMMHRALTSGMQLPAVSVLVPSQEPLSSSAKPIASSVKPPRPTSPSVRCTSGRNPPTLPPWTPSSRPTNGSASFKPPWAIRIAGNDASNHVEITTRGAG
ncbi:hypothetical protein B0H12DRAFT_1151240 [Mycena haematopus]|nr:hypothetical protein B0H12DRAFT_1151240 [Mycena haematopus]